MNVGLVWFTDGGNCGIFPQGTDEVPKFLQMCFQYFSIATTFLEEISHKKVLNNTFEK